MDAHILIKNSASKCNKELLTWLHSNIGTLKKSLSIKVVIVYEELYSKLNNKIKQLPTMILNGKTFTGISSIKSKLTEMANSKKNNGNHFSAGSEHDTDLANYWNAEMHSGVDNDENEEMDKIKRKAVDMSVNHKKLFTKKKKNNDSVSNTREDNVQIDNTDKISDMIPDDPMMQKFWENQETTPGFE